MLKKNKTEDEGIGRSHGGLSSKIHCSINEQGCPLSIYLSGGQVHDSQYGEALLSGKQVDFVIGDKAYASSKILKEIESMPAVGVIPPHRKAKLARSYDRFLYKRRNVIEGFFNKLKHYTRISSRYCKRGKYFLCAVKLAASIIVMLN